MMHIYLGEDPDSSEALDFLSLAEGEVIHYEALNTMAQGIKDMQVTDTVQSIIEEEKKHLMQCIQLVRHALPVYPSRDYLMRRKTQTTNMKSVNYKSYDKTNDTFRFDSLDINIIKELLTNSNVRTADIAARYKIPLSTIQRRRARIENSILEKKYHLDIKKGLLQIL